VKADVPSAPVLLRISRDNRINPDNADILGFNSQGGD